VPQTEFDAVVVGSGPNGLAAAIRLQTAGLSVLLVEAKETIGGGMRTAELTLPGFRHDVCSAVHPMGVISPFFRTLPLALHGLEWLTPDLSASHPLDDGSAGLLYRSLLQTVDAMKEDAETYERFIGATVDSLPTLLPGLLGPFPDLKFPAKLASFGWKALPPASWLKDRFRTPQLSGLWAGMAAHSMQPLDNWLTAAIGLVLMSASHLGGWPVAKGGSAQIAASLGAYFVSIGGRIQTHFEVASLKDLPSAKALLFDVTPRQLLNIASDRLPAGYCRRLANYRYGMGVFKIDWALDGPVPFLNQETRQAGTVHLGGSFQEIAYAEKTTSRGSNPEKPFVLLAQPSVVDPSRAPSGKHAVWAYCHVPHGSDADRTDAIENQVERFAPGFRERILARHTFSAREMEGYNPNYIGGDINGGVQDIFQHFSRPVLSLSPYRTPAKGIYICSSSTPPGGGVHGMCGFHAAERAIKDRIFE
jgi:phytoene dehydrogenase-like protein